MRAAKSCQGLTLYNILQKQMLKPSERVHVHVMLLRLQNLITKEKRYELLIMGPSGQPKYSTFLKKVILRCIGLCFNYHHLYLLSRLDQPLIQRIPAGLSSTVACLDFTPSASNGEHKLALTWCTGHR